MKAAYDISITTYCQAFCAGCQRNDLDGNFLHQFEQNHMDFDLFCKIMDQVDTLENIAFIQLCGELGDPMMHPRIDDILTRIFQTQSKCVINTNGALRNAKWYTKWSSQPGLQIEWGIDGLDHDTNWKYRVGVNWIKAWDNMTAWFDNNGKGAWHFILFEWNIDQVPEVAKLAKEKFDCNLVFKITESDTGRDGIMPGPLLTRARKLVNEYG